MFAHRIWIKMTVIHTTIPFLTWRLLFEIPESLVPFEKYCRQCSADAHASKHTTSQYYPKDTHIQHQKARISNMFCISDSIISIFLSFCIALYFHQTPKRTHNWFTLRHPLDYCSCQLLDTIIQYSCHDDVHVRLLLSRQSDIDWLQLSSLHARLTSSMHHWLVMHFDNCSRA